jgi:hypothetical protein
MKLFSLGPTSRGNSNLNNNIPYNLHKDKFCKITPALPDGVHQGGLVDVVWNGYSGLGMTPLIDVM